MSAQENQTASHPSSAGDVSTEGQCSTYYQNGSRKSLEQLITPHTLQQLQSPPEAVKEAEKHLPVLAFLFGDTVLDILHCSTPSVMNILQTERGVFEQMGLHFHELCTDELAQNITGALLPVYSG